jgi:glucose/arabinose dehydrogenase
MRGKLPIVLLVTLVTGFGLTACTGGGNEQDTVSAPASSTPVASAPAPTTVATPGPTASPTVSPAAASNRVFAAAAAHALAAANANPDDKAIVDALATTGFAKTSMQITPDTTSIGRAADSIQVSVLVGTTCLVGQFRGATWNSETAPVLSTGKCLIGKTRSIDW